MNTVTYTNIMKGFINKRNIEQAINIFEFMQNSDNCRPSQITFNIIIDGCNKNYRY